MKSIKFILILLVSLSMNARAELCSVARDTIITEIQEKSSKLIEKQNEILNIITTDIDKKLFTSRNKSYQEKNEELIDWEQAHPNYKSELDLIDQQTGITDKDKLELVNIVKSHSHRDDKLSNLFVGGVRRHMYYNSKKLKKNTPGLYVYKGESDVYSFDREEFEPGDTLYMNSVTTESQEVFELNSFGPIVTSFLDIYRGDTFAIELDQFINQILLEKDINFGNVLSDNKIVDVSKNDIISLIRSSIKITHNQISGERIKTYLFIGENNQGVQQDLFEGTQLSEFVNKVLLPRDCTEN